MQAWSVLCQVQARLIEQAAAAWDVEKDEPSGRVLIEELGAAALQMAGTLERGQKALWDMLFANQVRLTQHTGRSFLDCLLTALKACDDILARLKAAPQGNGLAGIADQVTVARSRLAKLQRDFNRRWPFLDRTALQQGQAEIERGECMRAEAVCRELQG